MALELIKISEFPQVTEPGEWIPVSGADGIAYKIHQDDFKAWLGTVQTIAPREISPTDPAPGLDGLYIPTEDGTYTNAGGLVVDRSEGGADYGQYVQFINDNGTWSKVNTPLPETDVSGLATKEEFETVEPVARMLVETKNKLDKSIIESGSYSPTTGAPQTTNNWIRTPLIELPAGDYILTGHGSISSTFGRVLYYDSNGVFNNAVMSTGDSNPVHFTVSAGDKVAIVIANAPDIGLDPTNNIYADAVMVRPDGTSDEYEPFGSVIDGTYVTGIPKFSDLQALDDDLSAQIDDNAAKIDALMTDYDIYGKFNGSTSNIPLGGTFTLSSPGDYIEFSFKLSPTFVDFKDGLGMFGSAGASHILGAYDVNSIWLRGLSTTGYATFSGLPDMQVNFVKIKIQVSDDGLNWDMYLNDNLFQSQPKNSDLNIDTVGNAYFSPDQYANFYLKYAKINSGGTIVDISDPSNYPGSVDVVKEYSRKSTSSDNLPSNLYEFSQANGELIAYSLIPESKGLYVGFKVKHEVNADPIVYTNQWRIVGALVYQYDGLTMLDTGLSAITTGESECVYRTPNKDDFTGGYHGDEQVVDFVVYVDDIPIPLDADHPLTICNEIRYEQNSTTHQTASGGVQDPNHTLEANHNKVTNFINGGYDTENTLAWQKSLIVETWYPGICCCSKDFGEMVYNEFGDVAQMVGDNSQKLTRAEARTYFAENITNGLKGYITSKIILPVGDDSVADMFVQDRPADNKYYRRGVQDLSVTDTDIFQSKMSVRFKVM